MIFRARVVSLVCDCFSFLPPSASTLPCSLWFVHNPWFHSDDPITAHDGGFAVFIHPTNTPLALV